MCSKTSTVAEQGKMCIIVSLKTSVWDKNMKQETDFFLFLFFSVKGLLILIDSLVKSDVAVKIKVWCIMLCVLKQKRKLKTKESSQSLNGEVISVKISVDLVFPLRKLGKPPDSQNGCFFQSRFWRFITCSVGEYISHRKTRLSAHWWFSDPKGDNLRANYISADLFRKVWCYAILSSGFNNLWRRGGNKNQDEKDEYNTRNCVSDWGDNS